MANDVRRGALVLLWLQGLAACSALVSTTTQAAPSVADYQRSLGLREQWITLTENLAWPAQWRDDSTFYYRKTVPGGFAFVSEDVATLQKQPAFDQARVALGLSKATGKTYTALRLPFERFSYAQEGERRNGAIRFELGEDAWRCTLPTYRCARDDAGPRPRGFGVVRDPDMPADNTSPRSPDGRWETLADGWNLILRRVSDGQVTRLSNDGRAYDYFDPESIAWSPGRRIRSGWRCIACVLGLPVVSPAWRLRLTEAVNR